MSEDKQIIVDEDKINETQIVINVKTLVIIVSFIVGSIGTMYGLLRADISAAKDDAAKDNIEVVKKVSEVKKSVDDLEIIKVEPLDEKYHTLDKQVYFLINRTNSRHTEHTSGDAPEPTAPTFP